MAKKAVQSSASNANQAQFLNYELSKAQKAKFQQYRDTAAAETVWERIEKLVDQRYDFSVKWDNFNECYSCFILSPKSDDGSQRVILTGRGRSAFSAVAGALFRHYDIFEGVWPVETVSKRGTDDD